MSYDKITQIFSDAINTAIPESTLKLSQWAERYRYVSAESGTARPGRWSNELVPFLVGPMDAITDPDVWKVILMKSSQVAGTEMLLNAIGYFIHIDPCPILYVAEIDDKANAFSKERLAPMLRDTDVLSLLVAEAKSRDADNTIGAKVFRGGHLAIGYATSAATLSSRARRVVMCDEVDAYGPTSEGDPIALAVARTKTYSTSKKIILVSSPRNKETSTIEPEYERSDQRKFYVPCPHCGEYQVLQWSNVKWDTSELAKEAYYVCDLCGAAIEHVEKDEMLAAGEWRALQAFKGIAGFWINELYSPFTTWGEMAEDFLVAKNNLELLKVFINTRLGQTWEDRGDQLAKEDISFHRENYSHKVPAGALFLTAGVDVQDNRLECEIVAWGHGYESWSIEYLQLMGDPGRRQVWDDLRDWLMAEYEGIDNRAFRVYAVGLDSGGHFTNQVYTFCHENQARLYFAMKGLSTPGRPLVSPPSKAGHPPVNLFGIGTETAKDQILTHFRTAKPGPGYCHFPMARPDWYFEQLCSERAITKFHLGKSRRQWIKISERARNEALDCRVYALAAVHILNPNFAAVANRIGNSGTDLGGSVDQTAIDAVALEHALDNGLGDPNEPGDIDAMDESPRPQNPSPDQPINRGSTRVRTGIGGIGKLAPLGGRRGGFINKWKR